MTTQPTGPVLLQEGAAGIVDADGNVSLAFNAPPVNRVWQGTVSILAGAPAGTQFTVLVGNQPYSTLYSPGPGGPYQVQRGQVLSLTYSGGDLTPGDQVTATLAGVNDPSDNPTSYTGPTAVTNISIGGS